MKVVVLESDAPALISFRGRLIEAMVAAGHNVVACAPGTDGAIAEGLARLGAVYQPVRLARTGINPLRDIETVIHLTRLFRRLGPDLLTAYTAKPVIYGSLAARLAEVPRTFTTIEGLGYPFAERAGPKGWLLGALQRILYAGSLRWSAGVFVLNPSDREFLLAKGIVQSADKVHLIDGIGVDLEHYRFVPVGTGQPSFLMICRLLRHKGVADFVEAARLIKGRYPEVSFRLAGPFDKHPDGIARSEIARWTHEGLIEYLGETNDVRPFLEGCSAFVLPSFYPEGLPRTILEAMATGRAIVTTDTPGCRETVVPGRNGFLIPARSPRVLANAIERLIVEPELLIGMGTYSRRFVEHRFDVRRINAIVLDAMRLA